MEQNIVPYHEDGTECWQFDAEVLSVVAELVRYVIDVSLLILLAWKAHSWLDLSERLL